MASAAIIASRKLMAAALGAALSFALVAAVLAAPGGQGGAKGKSYLCHATGNSWVLLHVSNAAIAGHIAAHGDYVADGPNANCIDGTSAYAEQ